MFHVKKLAIVLTLVLVFCLLPGVCKAKIQSSGNIQLNVGTPPQLATPPTDKVENTAETKPAASSQRLDEKTVYIEVEKYKFDTRIETISVNPQTISDALVRAIWKNRSCAEEVTLDDLPNESVLITTYIREKGSSVTIPIFGGVTKRDSTIIVTHDYMKYMPVTINDVTFRVGIAIRIKGELLIKDNNVSISDLYTAAIAVTNNKAVGRLSIDVIGISGRDITNGLPVPTKLTPDSILNSIQAAAVLKSRIYDGFEKAGNTNTGSDTGSKKPDENKTNEDVNTENKSNNDVANKITILPQIIALDVSGNIDNKTGEMTGEKKTETYNVNDTVESELSKK